jgi:hypothetical protein
MGSGDIGPIVIKCRSIFGIRGNVVTVKIFTTNLRIIIIIEAGRRNRR